MKSRLWNSAFVRIAVVAFAMLVVGAGLTSAIALNVLTRAVEDKQREIEQKAALELRGYLAGKITRVSDLLNNSNTRSQLGVRLARIAADASFAYNYDYIEYLLDFADTVCVSDADFQDCILVANNGMVYSQTKVQNGDAVASYDFLGDPLYADFLAGDESFGMVRDDPDRYTILPGGGVVSLLWSIYDPARLPEKARVGFMIVNIPDERLDGVVSEFSDVVEGDLQVVDGGAVIYDADMSNGGAGNQPIEYPLGFRDYAVRSLLPEDLIARERNALLRQAGIVFLAVAGISLLVIGLVTYSYNRRSRQLVETMRRVQEGDLSQRVKVTRRDEIGTLGEAFNDMAEQLGRHIDRTYTAELAQRDSEIALLQSQINPHFLYNALENMSMMAVRQGCDDVADLAADLGQLFRISIRSKELIVSIDSELEYVRLYINIQSARFGDELRFDVQVDPDLRACAIPKLILQPLVENAVIHGHRELKPGAWVRVAIGRADAPGMLRVSVSDNGGGMTPAQIDDVMTLRRSIGLPNAARRILLMFGEACALKIDSAPGEGTCISFLLPRMSVEEMRAHVQIADRG